MADFLVNGKRIRITGGSYMIDSIPASVDFTVKKENTMRIAVTFEDGKVGQHFGRTEKFKVYEIDDGKIKSSQVMDTNGAGHSELVSFLRASEVEAVICGGIGMGARNAIEELGIALFLGVDGDADTVVNGYLGGKLNFKSKEICSHHNHDGEHHCHGGNTNDECGSGCHR